MGWLSFKKLLLGPVVPLAMFSFEQSTKNHSTLFPFTLFLCDVCCYTDSIMNTICFSVVTSNILTKSSFVPLSHETFPEHNIKRFSNDHHHHHQPNLLYHHYLQQHPHLQDFHVATVFQVLIFPCLPIIMFRRWKMGECNTWGIVIIIIIMINNILRRRPLPHIWLHTCSLHGGRKGLAQIQYQKTQIGVSNSATDSDKSLS